MVSGLTENRPALDFHIKLSPKTKNIPKGISDNTDEKNNISIRIFLFSSLFIFLKNINNEIITPISIPTKWKS